jgi:hypothetical protein
MNLWFNDHSNVWFSTSKAAKVAQIGLTAF